MTTTNISNPLLHTIDTKVYGNYGNENVLKQIPTTISSVLDIGCGRGDNAAHLKKRGAVVDGITISEQELEHAKIFLRTGILHNAEKGLPDALKENKYDVVICSHVIEHLQYPQPLLKDIQKVMTSDSIFIVALPNIMHYRSRWELVKGNFKYQESGIWDNTHWKWYTFQSGIELLSANGFQVVKADVTGDVPLLSIFKRLLPGGLRARLFNFLKGMSKGFFGYELLYVCKIKTAE
jgi:2-polyprenyl-3-methyl-5-hydroxy-6-metoxy-1,4-benzoquinol methylase